MVSTVLKTAWKRAGRGTGYTKYDYRNKETDNSRNGYSEKTLKSSLGIWKSPFPVTERESLAQIVKKNQPHSTGI
jgi:hypothetical protein